MISTQCANKVEHQYNSCLLHDICTAFKKCINCLNCCFGSERLVCVCAQVHGPMEFQHELRTFTFNCIGCVLGHPPRSWCVSQARRSSTMNSEPSFNVFCLLDAASEIMFVERFGSTGKVHLEGVVLVWFYRRLFPWRVFGNGFVLPLHGRFCGGLRRPDPTVPVGIRPP